MKISVSYDFLPKTPTAHAAVVMDHFGIDFEQGRRFIAQDLELPIQAGDVVLFTGPSGSGKSSLLRIASQQLEGVINVDSLDLGNALLVDSLNWPVREAMELLAGCGLGEAHLMLRTPAELSEGQRYRFRLAKALSERPGWIVADEFSATLDRTLARVVAYNIRKLATRHKTGFLLATTHEDIVEDLNPDVWVRCDLSGEIQVERREPQKKKPISFANDLRITTGTRGDWPYFAGWHYRSHNLGICRFITVLWHGDEPIGICVFISPPIALKQRRRFFGLSGHWNRVKLQAWCQQLVTVSRVVLHPSYRGAGIASEFLRRSCRACPWPWIETQAEMGHINPFFERAGFLRVGLSERIEGHRLGHSAIYGTQRDRHGRKKLLSKESHGKSAHSQPVYYIFDNRANVDAARESLARHSSQDPQENHSENDLETGLGNPASE